MRRATPIRITKNDKQEYARLVRNAKAKIGRTLKNYGIDLTNEIQIPSIEDFETRSQFNEWKNKQRSFTNVSNRNYQFKKNEFNVVASKKELDEITRNTKKAQRIADKLRKEAEKKPFISGGKEQGTVGQVMKQMARPENLTGISRPKDFEFSKIRSRKQLESKMKNMEERADDKFFDKRMEKMKENFIKVLSLSLHNDADELIERLKNIPPDDFYEMYLMFDEFDFALWDSEGILFGSHDEAMQHVSKMLSYVDRYEQGKINMDMKGF